MVALAVGTGVAGHFVGMVPVLAVMTALGYVAAVAGLWRPVLGVFGLGVLCLLDPLSRIYFYNGEVFRWHTFDYFLLAVALVFWRRILVAKDVGTSLMGGLIFVLAAGLLWSSAPSTGVQNVLYLASYFGFLVVLDRASDEQDLWPWLAASLGILGVAIGWVAYREPAEIQHWMGPNSVVHCWLTPIVVGCVAVGEGRVSRSWRLGMAVLIVLNSFWAFLTGSRGGLAVAVLCLAFLAIRSREMSAGYAVAMALLAIVLAGFSAQSESSFHRIQKLFDPDASLAGRTSGRYDLLLAGWQLFLENPISGVGTGGFASRYSRLDTLSGGSNFRVGDKVEAHSGWVMVLAENGAPGILALGAFVASFALEGVRRRRLIWSGLLTTGVIAVALTASSLQSKELWFLAAATTVQLARPPRSVGLHAGRVTRTGAPPPRGRPHV